MSSRATVRWSRHPHFIWNHWPWWLGLALAVFTTAPYLWAAAQANATWAYTGFLFGVDDGLSYIAKMRLGAQGAWLFRTPYTTEPGLGLPAFTAYIALGHLLPPRASYAAFVLLFHGFRLAALAGLVIALARVLAWLLPDRPRAQALAALWATVGGGLGWLAFPLGLGETLGWGGPLSFYAPEAFGFLAVWGLPHLTAARAGWLYAWWAFARGHYRRAAMGLLAVLFTQPLFVVPLFLLALPTTWYHPRRGVALRALAAGATLAAIWWLPMLWARGHDPVVQAWDAQNNVTLPPPMALVLAYGPWLPWVGRGWRALHREHPAPARALALWLLAVPVLMSLPTSVQRRLLEGVWVAWGLLAVRGAADMSRAARLPLALVGVAPLLLWNAAWRIAAHPGEPLFRPRAETQAMHTWAQQVPLGAGVLASYPSSTALPAWAPVRAPAGHAVESPAWTTRREQVARFFAADTPLAQRRALLGAWRVTWVWWGPRERALGPWDPRTAPFLEPVFHQGDYWALRVREPTSSLHDPRTGGEHGLALSHRR